MIVPYESLNYGEKDKGFRPIWMQPRNHLLSNPWSSNKIEFLLLQYKEQLPYHHLRFRWLTLAVPRSARDSVRRQEQKPNASASSPKPKSRKTTKTPLKGVASDAPCLKTRG